MANFGPGTKTELKIVRKDWKAYAGAIENRNRPESVYLLVSSWIKPKLSVTKAMASATSDPNELAIRVIEDFDKSLRQINKRLQSCFSEKFFDLNSIIYTYDIAAGQAKVGKRQFIELEINIDTVNNIDFNGNPAPYKPDGKIYNIPFKDFVKSLEISVNKILELDQFHAGKSIVDFSRKK